MIGETDQHITHARYDKECSARIEKLTDDLLNLPH